MENNMELPPEFEVDRGILELESKIGVKEKFFKNLLHEDDWSFVIKLHALFEAACTHLLLFHFKEPALSEIFSRLELSNKTTGKVAFLSAIDLLNKENRKLIATLSEIRNTLVHDVRNSEFTLSELVNTITYEDLKRLAIAFSPYENTIRKLPYDNNFKLGFKPEIQAITSIEHMVNRFKADPKFHIWIGAYNVLSTIVDMYSYSDYLQWMKAKDMVEDDDVAP